MRRQSLVLVSCDSIRFDQSKVGSDILQRAFTQSLTPPRPFINCMIWLLLLHDRLRIRWYILWSHCMQAASMH